MQKFLFHLLAIVFWLSSLPLYSQVNVVGENLPIGGSSQYGPYYRPFANSNLNYSRFAYLYAANEVKMRAGTQIKVVEWLKSINFVLNGNNDFKIYLKNTSDNELGYSQVWDSLVSGATLVYNDTARSFLAQNNSWESFNLTDTFIYSGSSLMVLTDHYRKGTANGPNRFYFTDGFKRSIGYASQTPISGSAVLDSMLGGKRPTIRFQFVDPVLKDFSVTTYQTGFNQIVGFTEDHNGQKYVWEKAGKVWVIDTNHVKIAQPLLDISDEVGNWIDHGMLGLALDPDFQTNGYFYVCYDVDRHHLLYFNTPSYNPSTNEYQAASIGRITRYQADVSNNFQTLVPGSRFVLLGQAKNDGIPLLSGTHGINTILFGSDGTLLISTGDASSFLGVDTGYSADTYFDQALMDTIVREEERVGAYKAQLVDNLNGKILRIDRFTGQGVASNPFFDPSFPNAARSKVFALGFRNPYRMYRLPGTGSSNAIDGNPGTLMVGDVGWSTWEELNIVDAKGQNFGWPLYEGLTEDTMYFDYASISNPDAPNPLFGGSCTQEFFYFKDLLKQESTSPLSVSNPCDTSMSINNVHVFMHKRPTLDWIHYATPSTRNGTFDINGNAQFIDVRDSLSPISGVGFTGSASVAGVFYNKNDFPMEFRNSYYHADYVGGWIKQITFDNNNLVNSIHHFADSLGPVVHLTDSKLDGCLYAVVYPFDIKRICYSAFINDPPIVTIVADTVYGASPLTVNFDASQSYDPEGAALTYLWDFGDGTTASIVNPQHIFTVAGGNPTRFTVKLTCEDDSMLTATDSIWIWLNNTPPQITITSFNDGDFYSIMQPTILPLAANVSDLEHGPSELFYEWQTVLHHNTHTHADPIDTNRTTSTFLEPLGCGNETYFYRVSLKVSDLLGLSAQLTYQLNPNCNGVGVQELDQSLQTIIYPNPNTGDQLYIRSTFDINTMLVFDISGREVLRKVDRIKKGETFKLNLNSELKSGIYLIRFAGNQKSSVTRLIVH